jgi:hypothetical protein
MKLILKSAEQERQTLAFNIIMVQRIWYKGEKIAIVEKLKKKIYFRKKDQWLYYR